jgi:hypothetical protein
VKGALTVVARYCSRNPLLVAAGHGYEVRLRANGVERLVLELRFGPVEQTEEALA